MILCARSRVVPAQRRTNPLEHSHADNQLVHRLQCPPMHLPWHLHSQPCMQNVHVDIIAGETTDAELMAMSKAGPTYDFGHQHTSYFRMHTYIRVCPYV